MFLKTTLNSAEYTAVNGYTNGNQRLELVEDAHGDFFVTDNVKGTPEFSEILSHLEGMEEVDTIDFIPNTED